MPLPPARFRSLLVLSVVLGVMVGVFGAIFSYVWHQLDHLVWHHLENPAHRVWVSVLAGAVIGLIIHALHDPGTMATIIRHFHKLGRLPYEDNKPILPMSLIGLIAGQSAGPEGVLTQVCGSMGTWLPRKVGRRRYVRILTLAGMGAGFGAFLCAPIGGAILWLEMLHKRGLEYYEAVMPTLLCSCVGYGVMTGLLNQPIVSPWKIHDFVPDSPRYLLMAVALGLMCGPLASGYAFVFRWVGKGFLMIPGPAIVRTTAAGLIIGLLGYWFPLSYFYGNVQINRVLEGPLPMTVILGTLLAKMVAASVTIKGHWQGGLIIPHMFMGALIGKAVTVALPWLTQGAPGSEVLVMLCCMAGFNSAATQTPLASPLIVLALAGFGHGIPVFIASLAGFLAGHNVVLIDGKQPRTERPNFHLEPAPAGAAAAKDPTRRPA